MAVEVATENGTFVHKKGVGWDNGQNWVDIVDEDECPVATYPSSTVKYLRVLEDAGDESVEEG